MTKGPACKQGLLCQYPVRWPIQGDTEDPARVPVRKNPLTKTILYPANAEERTVAAVFKPLEEKARISFFRTTGQPAEPKD